MRNIYLILLFIIFSFSLKCKNTTEKQLEQQSEITQEKETKDNIEIKETKEIFSFIKPTNKPEQSFYKTIYDNYTISINSKSSTQEIIFTKGNLKISQIINFYSENSEIVFHLYESNLGNIVLLIEGRHYYNSNLGIYYIKNKFDKIVEVDDTLTFRRNNPETNGFKSPKAQIIKNDTNLICKIFLADKFLYDKHYNISEIIAKQEGNESDNEIVNVKINKYINDEDYFIKTFDINKDGIVDKLVSHNRYKGDELLIFIGNSGDNYNFLLKTTNFSEDGGNQISDIKKTHEGFIITTSFPDKGHYEQNYNIVYKNNEFLLTTLETVSTSWQESYTETCVSKNLNYNLKKPIDELLNTIAKTDKSCKKTKI